MLSPHRVASTVFGTVLQLVPDCEAHVRSVSNEPTSGCEARVQKSRHKGILLDEVVQRCCEKGVVVPGWCRQEEVLGDRDFVFGDELTRDNLLKIAVTADELREVNVYKVCVQPLDGSEFTVHVDVAACRISDLKSQIRAKIGTCARSRSSRSSLFRTEVAWGRSR